MLRGSINNAHRNPGLDRAVAFELNMICCTFEPYYLHACLQLLPLHSTLPPLKFWFVSTNERIMTYLNFITSCESQRQGWLTRDWPDVAAQWGDSDTLVSWVSVYNWALLFPCSLCTSHNLTTSSCVKLISERMNSLQVKPTEQSP